MSRWGRGRGGSVAVPLDSALFRENSNCPSAARSSGTVGKWGITSFTSIRSAPYAYSNVVKKPVQDQNSPLTVPAVETEQPPPKPKKFFKSRNTEPYPPVPQINYAPAESAAPSSPEHSANSKEKKKRAKAYNRDSSSPEAPRYRGSEKTKARKNSVTTKASKKEEVPGDETKPPNKRYLVRNRNKVINYAEDGSNSPVPDLSRYEHIVPPREPPPSPKPSPSTVSSPTYVKPGIVSPSSKDGSEDRKPPPIVLRISKGTSRIVSTDSNEGFTSPGSDRHSSMDTHADFNPELKQSPSMEAISSPKHEGLKITIKCSGLGQETSKKEKKKDKKDHKSHKRHHKNSDDEPLKKPASPQPGSDTYDLYKTLASPPNESKQTPPIDDIESQLAKLDSTEPVAKSPRLESLTEMPPEPKPPESSRSSRSRRNRPNVNYNENDDFYDAITARKLPLKPVEVEKKKETRKGRKKNETQVSDNPSEMTPEHHSDEHETPLEKNDLINILSEPTEDSKPELEPIKLKVSKKHKYKHLMKQSSPEGESESAMEEANVPEPESAESKAEEVIRDMAQQEETQMPEEVQTQEQPSQSPETHYNNMTESQEEDQVNPQEDVFKPPQGISDTESHSEDKPSVKLVITKKKGSIFKSKSLVNDNPSPLPARKRRHLYKHEWANDKGNETPRPEPASEGPAPATGSVPEELTRVTRYRPPDRLQLDPEPEQVQPYTSVRCAKEAKEYYTVVRNVKKAHQIQEIGEFQEFNDDVEYLLDALQDNNPMSTRCLSAITLASKCTAPAFRMHLRAHGTVQKFFSALHDATNDQSLGLCTATVMFVLSQDRLNMDLDRESLELMLNLLESDVSHKNALVDCGLTSAQLTKTQERVRELCAEIKSQGKANHLDLDNITVGHLAMETLLSLTSKRAGEWFKEELRVLGGVEHIVRTIQDCVSRLDGPGAHWQPQDMDVLRKADRCMRVLENVTQQNEENQLYLIRGGLGAPLTLAALMRRCVEGAGQAGRSAPAHARALLDAALPAVKVLVNLSHSFGMHASPGAEVIGQLDSLLETCLIILNNENNFVPEDKNFEFCVCVLSLLINLVQSNEANTTRLINTHIRVGGGHSLPAIHLLVQLFYKREELAKQVEEKTDALLDGHKEEDDKDTKKQSQDDIDETVAKLLSRAGTHMEHSMVGAYSALALGAAAGCGGGRAVRALLPRYRPLLPTLNKYYSFLTLTASAEASIVAHVKQTQRIIQFMENSDKAEDEPSPQYAPPDDLPQDMSISSRSHHYGAADVDYH